MTNKKDNKRVYERPLHLDMSFDEAMKRFSQTDSAELPDKIKLSQQKKKEPPDKKTGDPD